MQLNTTLKEIKNEILTYKSNTKLFFRCNLYLEYENSLKMQDHCIEN